MHIARGLSLGIPSASQQPPRTLDERVLASRIRARRRWVIQTGLFLLATAFLLVLMVIWRRDSTHITAVTFELQAPVAALQGRVDELGGLFPAALPDAHQAAVASYAGDAERFYAASSADPVIIAVSRPVPLMLREDGRVVVLSERGQLRTEWMPVSRFFEAMERQLEAMKAFDTHRPPPQLP